MHECKVVNDYFQAPLRSIIVTDQDSRFSTCLNFFLASIARETVSKLIVGILTR